MTDALSAYCADVDEPTGETVDEARRHLLDWLGLVAGGREHANTSESVLAAVESLAVDTSADEASAVDAIPSGIPTGSTLGPDRAAFLAGTFAHSLDFDDTHRESSLHPGAPVIAAALPVAREMGASGRDLLAAIVLGYDVACALGRAVGPANHYERGFHLTATCGTFGATAAVGRLREFDAETFEMAFGINGSQAAGSMQFLENGAWNKRIHPGLAARRAILASALATNGFRGSADPIEGTYGFLHGYSDDPRPDVFDEIEPGAAIRETAIKPYPCCRYVHAAIDALLDLAGEIAIDELESVTVDLPRPGARITGEPRSRKRRPTNFVDCQFSAPFAAALALSTGEAGLDAFLEAQGRLDDPALREVMDRVDVVSTARTNERYPAQWAASVVVEAGTRHKRFVEHPRGEPENPLSWSELGTKFRELVRSTPLEPRADAIVDFVADLGDGSTAESLFEAIERQ